MSHRKPQVTGKSVEKLNFVWQVRFGVEGLVVEVVTFHCKNIACIYKQCLLTLAQIQYRPERQEKTVRMLQVISTMMMKLNIVLNQKKYL